MSGQVVVSRPCYSMRLIRPFLKLLRAHPAVPAGLLEPLEAMDPDERMPIEAAHELLRGGVVLTGDADLGLKAAREIAMGEVGALEYVAGSAASVGDAMAAIGRYMRLVNDAVSFSVERTARDARVRLDSTLAMPREAESFMAAAFYVATQQRFGTHEQPAHTVHFQHARPTDTREYSVTFDHAVEVRFAEDFTGFTLALGALELPLPARDPQLHAVLRKHAETLLAELPAAQSFTARVREHVVAELSGGDPGVAHIAKQLHVSTRTLARRLEEEATTFKDVLDGLRRGLALRYTTTTDLQLSEIAFLLGFANAGSFHRAFRRWTGQAPIEYRRARRG